MKKIFVKIMLFAVAIMCMEMIMFIPANAVTILPTDSSSPRSDCEYLGIEGSYITQIQESIDRINAIRREACEEGVMNPATGAPLTEADYVPIQWSADLEYIARIRASEAAVTMDHARLNGQSIWSLKGPNGVSSSNEVIAWNMGKTMTQGIEQWYDEKSDWVNNISGAVTGHYTAMINPNNLYVGLGTFYSKYSTYPNTTAGEFCGNISNPDTSKGSAAENIVRILEVKNEYITYNISGSDTLSITADVTCMDYWGNPLITRNLTIVGDFAKDVKWNSSDSNIISISSSGNLTVKSCGSVVITANLPSGSSLEKLVSYQHSYETKTTAATCASEGKTVKTCKICGDTSTQIIPKTNNHTFREWVTTTVPTADKEGLETRTCTICNITETRALKYKPEVSGTLSNSSSNASSEASSNDNSSVSESGTPSDSTTGTLSDSTSSDFSDEPDSSSSETTSTEDSSASTSSDISSETSSSDETQRVNTSNSSRNNKSNISNESQSKNEGSSKIWVPIAIVGGIGAVGLAAALIRIRIFRKK